jgi:hypothetical protein
LARGLVEVLVGVSLGGEILKEGIELQEMLMAEVSQRLGEGRSREGRGPGGLEAKGKLAR